MYRIVIARSGYYYVQRDMGSTWNSDWIKVGGFFATRKGAEKLIRDLKGVPPVRNTYIPKVVGYY
jgi:hypothetical protein